MLKNSSPKQSRSEDCLTQNKLKKKKYRSNINLDQISTTIHAKIDYLIYQLLVLLSTYQQMNQEFTQHQKQINSQSSEGKQQLIHGNAENLENPRQSKQFLIKQQIQQPRTQNLKQTNIEQIHVEQVFINQQQLQQRRQQISPKTIKTIQLNNANPQQKPPSLTKPNEILTQQIPFQNILCASIQKDERLNSQLHLLQSTSFNVLQESTHVAVKTQEILTTENLFIQTHTQEINIDQSVLKRQESSQQIICQETHNTKYIVQSDTSFTEKKSKFSISKTLQINFTPQKAQQKVKQEVAKPEPLKIQNLFISSLRSKTQIKPPQSTIEKKPKPWQKFKIKKATSQAPAPVQATNKRQQAMAIVNTMLSQQKVEKIQMIESNQNKQLSTNQAEGQIKASIQNSSLEAKIQNNQSSIEKEVKIQQKKQNLFQPFKEEKIKPTVVLSQKTELEFHPAIHHPLQNSQPLKNQSKHTQQTKNDKQQEKIVQQSIKEVEVPLSQVKQVNQIPQSLVHLNIKEQEQQSISQSQKQQIEINYNLKKKSQEEQQRLSRQKIKQLQDNIKKLTEINKQLQKSVSLPIKLLVSTVIGLGSGGITWAIKKDKLGSIIVGIASTMATLVLFS